jgi:hypothetical protein
MRALSTVFVVAIALLVSGCGNKEARLIGKYKGEMAGMPAADDKNNPMAGLAKAMAGSLSLELKADHKFTLNVIFPLEGTWSVSGDTVTLKVEKAMGMDVDSLKDKAKSSPGSKSASSSSDANKPIELKVSADGKTLTAQDPKGTGGKMTFVKESS